MDGNHPLYVKRAGEPHEVDTDLLDLADHGIHRARRGERPDGQDPRSDNKKEEGPGGEVEERQAD